MSQLDWQASELERLAYDYLKAKAAIDGGAETATFRGQPVTCATLSETFFAAGASQGFGRTGLLMAVTLALN